MNIFNIKDKCSFIFIVLSFFIAIYFYLEFSVINKYMLLWGLILFIPTIYLYNRYTKNKTAAKICNITESLFIILFIQCFWCVLILIFISFFYDDLQDLKTNTSDYKNFSDYIMEKDKVAHFPSEIPKEATNFAYYNESGRSEGIYIVFDIDKQYIDNELKKHKFQKIEGPFKDENKHSMLFNYVADTMKEPAKEYKVYYLGLWERGEHNFQGLNGIATKDNRILYFYGSID